MASTQTLSDLALLTLQRAVNSYFKAQWFTLVVVMLLLILLVVFGLLARSIDVWLLSVSALLMVLCLYAGFGLLRYRKEVQTAILPLLRSEPERVVWLYLHEYHILPFGIGMSRKVLLTIGYHSGDKEIIRLGADGADIFVQMYTMAYPHITLGYSLEKEQLFEVSPELLRKNI